MPHLFLVLAAVLLSVSSFGCAGEPPRTPGELALELGSGSFRFEAIEDETELDMVAGSQGGWHVWISLRALDLHSQESVLVEIESRPADTEQGGATVADLTSLELRFDPVRRDGSQTLVGITHIFKDPGCSVGVLQRMRATITDASQRTATDERYFVPRGGTYPPPACPQD